MSDAVAQSLITAGAGFFGALLGAVAAVFGPWWVRRAERTHEAEQARIETRRAAIVEWVDANVTLSNASPLELHSLSARANHALTDLSSRLGAGEKHIDDWVHGVGVYGSGGVDRYWRRQAYGTAGRLMLAWHREDIPASDLRPFMLDAASGRFESRSEWPSAGEIRSAFPEGSEDPIGL